MKCRYNATTSIFVSFVLSLYSYVAVYILVCFALYEFQMNVKRSIYHNDFDYLRIHSTEFEFIARQIKMFRFRRVSRSTNTIYLNIETNRVVTNISIGFSVECI